MSLHAATELELRRATIDDAEAVADAATALRPDDPMDPLVLRHDWFSPEPSRVLERFAMLAGNRVVGLCKPWNVMAVTPEDLRTNNLADTSTDRPF